MYKGGTHFHVNQYTEKGIPEARRGPRAGLSYFFPEELGSKLVQAFTPFCSN